MNASSDGDPSAWVGQARFAIEGVTQGLVGLFGLVGEFKLFISYSGVARNLWGLQILKIPHCLFFSNYTKSLAIL